MVQSILQRSWKESRPFLEVIQLRIVLYSTFKSRQDVRKVYCVLIRSFHQTWRIRWSFQTCEFSVTHRKGGFLMASARLVVWSRARSLTIAVAFVRPQANRFANSGFPGNIFRKSSPAWSAAEIVVFHWKVCEQSFCPYHRKIRTLVIVSTAIRLSENLKVWVYVSSPLCWAQAGVAKVGKSSFDMKFDNISCVFYQIMLKN